jgi:hypothetical protein
MPVCPDFPRALVVANYIGHKQSRPVFEARMACQHGDAAVEIVRSFVPMHNGSQQRRHGGGLADRDEEQEYGGNSAKHGGRDTDLRWDTQALSKLRVLEPFLEPGVLPHSCLHDFEFSGLRNARPPLHQRNGIDKMNHCVARIRSDCRFTLFSFCLLGTVLQSGGCRVASQAFLLMNPQTPT